jgi:hypothetical protein
LPLQRVSAKPETDRPGEDDAEQSNVDKRKPHAHPSQPAAGPHAKPELTNPDATPGAGLLADTADPQDAPDSASS